MEAAEASYRVDRFRAMNTDIEIALSAEGREREQLDERVEEARMWFAYAEQTFSRFLPESELSRLNRAGGKPMLVSETMLEVLQRSEQYRQLTAGLFEPFVLPALERAGYRASFERLGELPALPSPEAAGEPGPIRPELILDQRLGSASILGGGKLDLGGIVKGWSAERLARRMTGCGIRSGMISAGGDLSVWGGSDADPWQIEIADPWNGERPLAAVRMSCGAAATSSVLGRKWTTDRGVMHHLIDPRTMRPAVSDVVQCTVMGSDLVECEVYAKILCLLGTAVGARWLRENASAARGKYRALVVTADKQMHDVGGDEAFDGDRTITL